MVKLSEEAQKELNDHLLKAAESLRERGVMDLLALGADVNAQNSEGNTPLIEIILNAWYGDPLSHRTIVQALLDNGANVHVQNHQGETALYWAVQRGCFDFVRMFHEHGADVSSVKDVILAHEESEQVEIQKEFQKAFVAFQDAKEEMENATQKLADSALGKVARAFKEAKRNKTNESETVFYHVASLSLTARCFN